MRDCAGTRLLDQPQPLHTVTYRYIQARAFWINLYNCFVMHATVTVGAPTDPPSRKAFFSGTSGAIYK